MESEVMSTERAATPEPLKRETSVTPPGSGRKSPPPNCAICLGCCQNKSFTDSCLHQFCFNCLLTWSKIKAECPLCKQTFKSIIHNVRSNHQYEEYLVEQRQAEVVPLPVDDPPDAAPRRFRYRTTITFPRSERSAIQRLLVGHVENAPPPRPDTHAHRRPFRHTVYRHNLWARPLPDFTGRLRECSPHFYRTNEVQKYRLVPWLTRELEVLLGSNHSQIAYIMGRILDLLPVHAINSLEFAYSMLQYLGDRTEHFLYELLCFATTPYDMLGYDRNVQYGPDPRLLNRVDTVISSTDTDSDSDVVVVRQTTPTQQVVIPIETISHSESEDSSSEVIMTGYIKPPQDRTPEIVDLLASDSDVLIQEDTPPPSTSRDLPSASALVKLTLSRKMRPPDTDSDEDYVPETPPKRRNRRRNHSQDSASTTSTRRTTPSPTPTTSSSFTVSPPRIWESDCSGYTPPPLDIQRVLRSKKEERRKRKKKKRNRSPTLKEYLEASKKTREAVSKKYKRKREKSRSRISSHDRPGTSGTQRTERKERRGGKRLRSVVCTPPLNNATSSNKVPNNDSDKPGQTDGASGSGSGSVSGKQESSQSSEERSEQRSEQRSSPAASSSRFNRKRKLSWTDSDDDIPLNLTVGK